jgi:hypothetical protein
MTKLQDPQVETPRKLAARRGPSLSRILITCICIMLTVLACTLGRGEGSEERASDDPGEDMGTPDVYDDFSGTNPEFELDNATGVARGWYNDGRFNITYPARGRWTWYSGGTAALDFYVDIVVYNGDQCADRDTAGLVYRYVQSSDAGLLFGIACGGGYFSGIHGALGAGEAVCMFTSSTPSEPQDLDCSYNWDHKASDHINEGPGEANRIGIRAVDTQITLYINGNQVETFTITSSLPQYGEFALYLGTAQYDNASASFDDFSLWLDPEEAP